MFQRRMFVSEKNEILSKVSDVLFQCQFLIQSLSRVDVIDDLLQSTILSTKESKKVTEVIPATQEVPKLVPDAQKVPKLVPDAQKVKKLIAAAPEVAKFIAAALEVVPANPEVAEVLPAAQEVAEVIPAAQEVTQTDVLIIKALATNPSDEGGLWIQILILVPLSILPKPTSTKSILVLI